MFEAGLVQKHWELILARAKREEGGELKTKGRLLENME